MGDRGQRQGRPGDPCLAVREGCSRPHHAGVLPRGGGRHAPPQADRVAPAPAGAGGAARRGAEPGRRAVRAQREADQHPARGARPGGRAQGGGRPARRSRRAATASSSAATRTAPSTSSPAAASCGSRSRRASRSTSLRRGQEVMLNEALNVVARARVRAGRRGRDAQGGARGRRPRPGDRAHRRGADRQHRRHAGRTSGCAPATRCCWSPAPAYVYEQIPKSEVEELVLEEVPDIDYGDIGGLSAADRADPRRRRAAVPARGPVPGARAAPAEGDPALRPARLRQDADRQGGGQLAGQEGRRARRAERRRRRRRGPSSSTSRARSC